MPEHFSAHSRPLPALIALAFADITEGLMTHVHAAGFTDLRLHHLLNVFRFMSPAGERPARLARLAGVTPQAMSLTVGELTRGGYVRREQDPTDGRSSVVRWSERGLAAGGVAEEWFVELERRWAADVGKRQLSNARTVLATIVEKESS